jgi:2-dehydro-3-deoxygluconokinase
MTVSAVLLIGGLKVRFGSFFMSIMTRSKTNLPLHRFYTCPEHLSQLIEAVSGVYSNGGTIVFDTNYRPKGWRSAGHARDAITQIAPYVSVALPTFEDEQELFGYQDVSECADFWNNYGAKEVVVKSGPEGAYVNGVGWIKPDKVIKPLDTTGAGDSFNGGYLAARMKGLSVEEAVQAAHALAAKVLMTPGAILPLNR